MMFEILEKENFANIDNDNNDSEYVKKIKKLTPSNIKNYSKKELISLMKEENQFFSYINIDTLKLFNNEVIKDIPKKIISSLTNKALEKFASAGIIKYMKKNFLEYIDISVLSKLSDNFYKQITIEQFEGKDNILKIVKSRKIHLLDKSIIEIFYKNYFNKVEDDKDMKYLLSKSGKNFEYLTLDNFIYLGEFIGETNELDCYFEKLRKFRFKDKDKEGEIKTNLNKEILNLEEFKDKEQLIVIHNEIKERIQNFLSEGECYELLKDYCIKCLENEDNKQLAIQTLLEILNEPTYNIFQKIDHYKILEILNIIDNNQENQIKYYIKLRKLINEINILELYDPCEFYEKVHFFSQIINDKNFDDDFLEILAEENYGNMKYLINQFFSGTDKNAIPENLRIQYVQIIKDYIEIIKRKYIIDEDKIVNGLSEIIKDKENLELNHFYFLKTLSIPEKLYYDLSIQSIMEMPSFEKNVEEKFTILFKFIRDISFTAAGVKLASLTGSKVLSSVAFGIGFAKILKNIKDEVMKQFFRLSESQKRIYLINYRNSTQSILRMFSRKIREGCRKIFIPVKKCTIDFIRKKIFKTKDTKIGFDRLNFTFKDSQKLREECTNFRNSNIELYINRKKLIIRPAYESKLKAIRDKYKEKLPKDKSKKFKEFSKVKEKLNKYLVNKMKKELKKKYPEFEDTFLNKVKQKLDILSELFCGIHNGFMSSLTYNIFDLRIKDSKSKLLEKLLNNVKKSNYEAEFDKIKEYENKCNINTINDEIKYLIDSSADKIVFNYIKVNTIKSKERLDNLKKYLKSNMLDKNYEINIIKISKELENIHDDDNNISMSSNDNLDDKSELLIEQN